MDTVINPQRQQHSTYLFHLLPSPTKKDNMPYVVRYNGTWFVIDPREFEPERQTTDVAWIQIKDGVSPEEAYRRWFENQRKITRLLQQ
jgi:hypothetical protein